MDGDSDVIGDDEAVGGVKLMSEAGGVPCTQQSVATSAQLPV
jgi:hypothetical protein